MKNYYNLDGLGVAYIQGSEAYTIAYFYLII